MEGTVINIQKYSVHDGPGIRTTVFLKGCPLKCWWCHNPESINPKQELMFFAEKCVGCGKCVESCLKKAIGVDNNTPVVNQQRCILCGKCSTFCYNHALELVGQVMTVREVMKHIQKDEIFYEESGGGVTFSGGEPFVQIDFLEGILSSCKERYLHTTVDTCGFTTWDNFARVVDNIDLFLYDLKMMDSKKHEKYTGVSNEVILNNLLKLSALKKNIYIRIPIIPGINDDEKNLKETFQFLQKIDIGQINLLPYHEHGLVKYERINYKYKLPDLAKPLEERMEELLDRFSGEGFKVKIGG